MARPSQTAARRQQILPVVARTFAELGYRRTTTSELARRAEVAEPILYRLWPDKKAMFVAAIQFVFDHCVSVWQDILVDDGVKASDSCNRRAESARSAAGAPSASRAERLLAYESTHHGEFGLYRIIFAGLSEMDDPQVRQALSRMYVKFRKLLTTQIDEHRAAAGRRRKTAAGAGSRPDELPDSEAAAWALIGLGTLSDLLRELDLVGPRKRARMFREIGSRLIGV